MKKGHSQPIPSHQWLSDLHWTIHSPLMVNLKNYHPTLPNGLYTQSNEKEIAFSINDRETKLISESLTLAPPPKSHFLGPYFEHLWHSAVELSKNLKLIERNLQIHHRGHTLGEFDFLLKDETKDVHLHQEIAVKFYLGLKPSTANQILWFGPNQIDRLDLKVKKLIESQTKLGNLPQAQSKLRSLGISSLQPEIVIKGYLFQPLEQKLALPDYINSNALMGYWLTLSEVENINYSQATWYIPPKIRWLSSVVIDPKSDEATGLVSENKLMDTLKNNMVTNKPQLLIALEHHQNIFIERVRYFIVPDNWPEQASIPLLQEPSSTLQSSRMNKG